MKPGRNDLCPCGSGRPFGECCEAKREADLHEPDAGLPDVTAMLQEALRFHQSGELSTAEELYRKIKIIDPFNADALHLLGLLCHQKGDYFNAEVLIREAIASDPHAAFFYVNLGNTLKARGKTCEAIAQYRKAISIDPLIAQAHYNLANELQGVGERKEAIVSYMNAIRLNPMLAEAYYNMGVAMELTGEIEEAVRNICKAIEIRPDYAEAYQTLGVLFDKGSRPEEALNCYRKALELDPTNVDACFNTADILRELGRAEESESYFSRLISMKPGHADAYNGLSVVLRQQGKIKEAIKAALRAVEIKPDHVSAYNNLGLVYREDGHPQEAVAACREALSLLPGFADAEWNLGLAYLQGGDLRRGWRQYEWRFLNSTAVVRQFPVPRWDGSSPEGKTMFVYAEQGIGDQVMFSSMIRDLMSCGARIVVECDTRLKALFLRSFSGVDAISVVENPEGFHSYGGRSFDFRIPIGSLAGFLRPGFAAFPGGMPYLKADETRSRFWKDRFEKLGTGLKVGLSWRGGGEQSVKLMRSIPLSRWAGITAVDGCHFINLQYGDVSEELRRASEESGAIIHNFSEADPLKDQDEFAALISALDLVLSVDNSTVHLSGALGVPTLALLPRGCDWRWMNEIEDSPWYRSVRLVRQKEHLVWDEALEKVEAALKRYSSEGAARLEDPVKSYSSINETEERTAFYIDNIRRARPRKTYRCAVVTPVGPGHRELYQECRESVERSFEAHRGCFSEVVPLMVDDAHGRLGRSKARNLGLAMAVERGADWIFFLDADDIMAPRAFEFVTPYLENYDAIWGAIWSNEKERNEPLERPGQLPFLLDMDDLTACDPFTTLQMGHFVRLGVAQEIKFNEDLDTCEDFDYYMRVWERYRCLKIPLPFFHNIRGRHSEGPKSATSIEWRKAVIEMLNRHRRKKISVMMK